MADQKLDFSQLTETLTKLAAQQTLQVTRCPHCKIANPHMPIAWGPQTTKRADGRPQDGWATYCCSTCGGLVTTRCSGRPQTGFVVEQIFPEAPSVAQEIPETARRYLQQAQDTLNAPDAAAVMAGSAVDAMLKHLSFVDGSVYQRIEKAVQANVLTKSMGEWAHSVRLGSNRPRHADAEKPHATSEEAAQSVEFATALGQFLFVLTARVERGIEKAKAAEQAG